MRPLAPLAACLGLAVSPATGQAPPQADLWRVATASLTVPPALLSGPTAQVWNPAARHGAALTAGLHLIQTSDILGLSGVWGAVTHSLGRAVRLGVAVGRMSIRDLVRTTTSPSSTPGTIPVYTQFANAAVSVAAGPASLGGGVTLHDARLDTRRTGGVTIDLGAALEPIPRLTLAAASHLLPPDLDADASTDFYTGAEYALAPTVRVAGMRTRLVARYGATYRGGESLEHALGAGAAIEDQVHVDVQVARESGYASHAWRPGIGVTLAVGRYVLTVARASGVNDVGATYRLGLDVGLTP